MREFKVTYFFDQEHYIRRFIFEETQAKAEELIQSERSDYVSFHDRRGIYHELHPRDVRVIQISEYHRKDKRSGQCGCSN
ncbi:hypothetical protein [Sediminibacillus albus]|uniref:hypothetical protein n=1 Tax=Sediminibacillus albus TaxID=407036 RepID=UPI000B804195|nr:hypothetical protein [Sediminibacillus albus]